MRNLPAQPLGQFKFYRLKRLTHSRINVYNNHGGHYGEPDKQGPGPHGVYNGTRESWNRNEQLGAFVKSARNRKSVHESIYPWVSILFSGPRCRSCRMDLRFHNHRVMMGSTWANVFKGFSAQSLVQSWSSVKCNVLPSYEPILDTSPEWEVFICITSGLHNHRFSVAFLKMARWLTYAYVLENLETSRRVESSCILGNSQDRHRSSLSTAMAA